MADVLVVFGSKSDSSVYSRIMNGLKDREVSAELRICSAHKTPEMLDQIIAESGAKLFIAGAGLAAALPGVIASKTTKPVVGVPVGSNYAGLDALLSIVQMPSGFPVIATGVNATEQAVAAADLALERHSLLKITGNQYNQIIKQKIDNIKPIANKLGVNFEFIHSLDGSSFDKHRQILINVIELASFSSREPEQALALNVPILKESSTPEALELFEKSRKGLWIGLNRVENAFIAAAQLLSIHNQGLVKNIAALRQQMAKKVIEADKTESEKFRQSK